MPRIGPGQPRTRPAHVLGDKGYSSRAIRTWLRRHGIGHTIPERADQVRNRLRPGSRGGRPPAFDKQLVARALRVRVRTTGDEVIEGVRDGQASVDALVVDIAYDSAVRHIIDHYASGPSQLDTYSKPSTRMEPAVVADDVGRGSGRTGIVVSTIHDRVLTRAWAGGGEVRERITARRGELDTPAAKPAEQLEQVNAEREELAVAERILCRPAELAAADAAPRSSPRWPAGRYCWSRAGASAWRRPRCRRTTSASWRSCGRPTDR